MTQYRLHINIPLGDEKEYAVYKSNLLLQEFFKIGLSAGVNIIQEKYDITEADVRLSLDGEPQDSNHLDKSHIQL